MPDNRIVAENAIVAGRAPKSYWDVASSTQIEGFATNISVNAGTTVDFKINVNGGAGSDYTVEIFRLGYYGGSGAREVAEWTNGTAVVQPNALYDSTRALVDAGNWSVTDSWSVPADAVSGVYLARLQRLDANGVAIAGAVNQIPFIVRNDGVAADIVLQTSDTTWHAYNGWFGNNGKVGANFYGDASGTVNQPDLPDDSALAQDRAYAVSYNRPFITRDGTSPQAGGQDYLFGADYAAISWLEQNGYDVSYISGVDTDRLGADYLKNYKSFISVGHDEYWSGDQRANVEEARDAGVNLLFLSGNEVYWKTRWETSISADGTEYRTLVCYKETLANADPNAGPEDYANLDPSNIWTGTWRDTRFLDAKDANGNYIAGGADPDPISGLCAFCNCAENSLTGQLFGPDGTGQSGALDVPVPFAGLRIWRDTTVANGGKLDIAPGILGYEWNTSPSDDLRPAGLIKLSETTIPWGAILVDDGNTTSPGVATHNLSLYRAPSGALVFGAGTVFWSWALSNQHDGSPYNAQIANIDIQQFMLNMFADMGIQPGVSDSLLQSYGLVRALASTDKVAATVAMDDIASSVSQYSSVTITGTATDNDGNALTADGKVAVVEVSTDGGETWKTATTTDNWAHWSFTWQPLTQGSFAIKARAVDDSLNVYNAVTDSDAVTVAPPVRPSTFHLFEPALPVTASTYFDGTSVELGMKFSVAQAGVVTELKYWRGASDAIDTDVRQGHLWKADGTLIGTVTFTSTPGQSGWQTAKLTTPVALVAGTQYLVSYHTDNNYVATADFFGAANDIAFDGLDNDSFWGPFGMVQSPQDSVTAHNGLYTYGSGTVMPTQSFEASNYWVDITFDPSDTPGNLPPTITTAASLTMAENKTAVTTVAATDPNGNPIRYSIVGGADAAQFTINATSGALSFVTAPDWELPSDAGKNNVYDVIVGATDSLSPPTVKSLAVTVTNVTEAPVTTSSLFSGSVPAVFEADASDYELGTRFSASQGGTITDLRYFRGAADAGDVDNRTLSLWRADGVLLATVAVSASAGATGWQTGHLSTPVTIQAGTKYIVSYGFDSDGIADAYAFTTGYFTTSRSSLDGVLTGDASGQPTGSSTGGVGNGLFGSIGALPQSSYFAGNYWVDVVFQKGTGSNVAPVITSGAAFSVSENLTAATTVVATDANGNPLTFSINGGADAALFAINAASGALSFKTAPNFEVPKDAGANNVYNVVVQVSDGSLTASKAIAVTVTNSTTGVIIAGTSGNDTVSPTKTVTGQRLPTDEGDNISTLGGNDTLDGGTGADTLIGGLGNDTYITGGGDTITEASSAGADLVQSSVSLTLGANLEYLTLTGTAAISGTGNTLANSLTGNAAANTLTGLSGGDILNGGSGADTLVGGLGNDTYVTDGGDSITEAANAGTDLVRSSVSLTLGANVENLTLTGTAAINGTGNSLANTLTGNGAANALNGSGGADILAGGLGNDSLTGGTGSDAFVFNTAFDTANVDRITDFSVIDDTIRLENAIFTGLVAGTLSATAFVANAIGAAVDASDRIIYETDTGRLLFDADGAGSGASRLFATLAPSLSMTSADFLVI